MASVTQTFRAQGYVVLGGLFSADEIEQLRGEVAAELRSHGTYRSGGTVLPNAAVNGAVVPRLVTRPEILSAVRAILDDERPVFTLEADLHSNYMASAWHKDTGESVLEGGYFQCDPIGREDCLVIKVAIYLQDHSRHGGLSIRPESHTSPSLEAGVETELRLAAGDVVIFDTRLTHRGTLPSLPDRVISRAVDILPVHDKPRTVARLRSYRNRMIGRPDRLAVYFAYGLPGERTATFARRNMDRQLSQHGTGSSAPDEDLERFLQRGGVDVASAAR